MSEVHDAVRKAVINPIPVELFEFATEPDGLLADIPGDLVGDLSLQFVNIGDMRIAAHVEQAGERQGMDCKECRRPASPAPQARHK